VSPTRTLPERATCERCSTEVPLTHAERKARVGPAGEFVCDRCKIEPLRRRAIRI